MRTILVDDEIWMLRQFEDECNNIPDMQMLGTFRKATQALEFAKKEKIDLALLDVEMPDMNGLELASELRRLYPQIIIIFVSAYENYMADAFRNHNADYYILKPYKREDVISAIERAKLLSQRQRKRAFIRTFGRFDLFVDGEPIQFASAKAKELLAVLTDRCGEVVNSEEAFSTMWEDKPYDHANASVYRRAVQKLQQTLAEADVEELLLYLPRGRAVNKEFVDCDYFSFLEGDIKYIRLFNGEYMSNYSWSEYTLPKLNKMKSEYEAKNENNTG